MFAISFLTGLLALWWLDTIYVCFVVYDDQGFNSRGFNLHGIDRQGNTQDDYDCVDFINIVDLDIIVNKDYSRLEHVPEILPLLTRLFFVSYLC